MRIPHRKPISYLILDTCHAKGLATPYIVLIFRYTSIHKLGVTENLELEKG
jgi:hypothetical protein